jgi:hypothetical protein
MPIETGPIPAYDEPLEIEVIEGEIVITGPDGFCGSLTPEAATESERRLRLALSRLAGSGAG